MTDRKRLLRAVIESVQVIADGATERVQATVTWAGGHQTYAALSRPVARIDQLSYYPALTQRIRALAGQAWTLPRLSASWQPRACAHPACTIASIPARSSS